MRKKTKGGTPPDVVEGYATALIAEDILVHCLEDVGVSEPWKYENVMVLTQAFVDGDLPRYTPAPMLPVSLYAAWRAVHDAGKVWDKHFRHKDG